MKRINFYTSTCFEGCDIYDPDGMTYIVSDGRRANTLVDISTLFTQICGRIRNSRYQDRVTHIFSTTRYSQDVSLNERYIRVEGNRLQVDRNLVNKDIVNFKICRHIYRQYTNLANELCNNGYKIDRRAYSNITERLEQKPTARVKFKDLFEEYVLLKSEEPTFSLNNNEEQCAIITKQRPLVARAYNELSVDRVRELNYHTGNIERELTKRMTTPTEHKIVKMVSVALPHYKVIPKATAKAELQRVYDTLGIKQRAKATDLQR